MGYGGWADNSGTARLPRDAFRPSAIFLALVAAFVVSGALAWAEFGSSRFDVFLMVVSGWLVSLCLHEYAHAVTAFKGGDRAVAHRGYLTLNPLKYAHPILSLLLPAAFVILGGIGLPGGAVWVDHGSLRSRKWESLVSFAGPAVNLLCALLLTVPFWLGVNGLTHRAFWSGLAFLALLQLMATMLNLLPVPGLDGGGVIEPWLSPQGRRGFRYVAPYGALLVLLLLWQSPVLNGYFFRLVYWLADLLGLPSDLAQAGGYFFRFWT